MATGLRNRLKHVRHRKRSPSQSVINTLPATRLDLEANATFFGTSLQNGLHAMISNGNLIYSPNLPSPNPPLIAMAASLTIMFLSDPQSLLCAALSFLLFASYPSWFPRWTILIPLVLPMTVPERLEVVTFLLLVIWLHVGCGAEWWFVVRRLEEAWGEWMTTLRK